MVIGTGIRSIYHTVSSFLLAILCISGSLMSLCEASMDDGKPKAAILDENKGNNMNSGGSLISKAFFVLLAIQLLPGAIKVLTTYYEAFTVPKTKVGLITISGVIHDGSRTVYEIKTLLENKDIKALVLKIESPGGAPGASYAIYDAIRKLSQKHGKPVIAWIENIGASGGYYIAAAANHIICTPSALVGSVGVYMARPYLKDFIEQHKARYLVTHAGKYKAAGNPFKELTADDQKMFDTMLQELHQRFIEDMMAVRPQLANIPRELWAEGQPINGDKAFDLGLVDEIGSQLTVEDRVKELAGITTEIEWVKPAKRSPLAKLFGSDESDDEHPYISAAVDRIYARLTNQCDSLAPNYNIRY